MGHNPGVRFTVFDDTADLRELVATALGTQPGFEAVGMAGTVDEALAVTAAEQPDLIVTDSLAGPDGTAAYLDALRAAAPGARIVVFSGYLAKAFPAPVRDEDFVLKGDGVRRLVEVVQAGIAW